jgi:hypothetical protein
MTIANSQADANLFLETYTFAATSYLVNGDGQTGTSLVVDGGGGSIHKGQTFTVAGVTGTYTVTSVTNASLTDVDLATTVTTIKFTPTLASAASNDSAITLSSQFTLPSRTILNDITIVNNASSNAVTVATSSDNIAHGFSLKAGAGITLNITNADLLTIKGNADETISIMGS